MTIKNKAKWQKAAMPEMENAIMEDRAMTGEEVLQEISALRDYIQKMKDDKLANKLKKSLNEAADRL